MPRVNGWLSSFAFRLSYVLHTWTRLPNSSTRFVMLRSKKPCVLKYGSSRWAYMSGVRKTASPLRAGASFVAEDSGTTTLIRPSGTNSERKRSQPRLPAGAGDHVIERSNEMIYTVHIAWVLRAGQPGCPASVPTRGGGTGAGVSADCAPAFSTKPPRNIPHVR